jgi:uncharacterized membrane protein
MLIREIFSILDIIGLGMLLGGAIYESIVMAPNYRTNVPESLKHVRGFMKTTNPAYYFRVFSPATIISLIVTIIVCWRFLPARWWFIGAFVGQVVTDTITYTFHYPINRILFLDPLISDNQILKQLTMEWGTGNKIRVLLLAIINVSAICGLISLVRLYAI